MGHLRHQMEASGEQYCEINAISTVKQMSLVLSEDQTDRPVEQDRHKEFICDEDSISNKWRVRIYIINVTSTTMLTIHV